MMRILLSIVSFLSLLLCSVSEEDNVLGVGPEVRIVGGEDADAGRYPYMVTLIDCDGDSICGGSLVASDWVLTSADCRGYAVKVHIGRHSTSDGRWAFEEIEVDYEKKHPLFFGYTMVNDFNLMKLKTNSTATPVKMFDGSERLGAGTEVTALGWGSVFPSSTGLPSTLQEATISVVPNGVCSTVYFCYERLIILPSMMCAYGFMKDACDGDFGGPLIMKGATAADDVQVGIISWGAFCANPIFPGVYARVSKREKWLNRIIDGEEGFSLLDRIKYDTFRSFRRGQYHKFGKSVVGPDKKKLQEMHGNKGLNLEDLEVKDATGLRLR